MKVALAGVLATLLMGGGDEGEGSRDPLPVLYFFFSPETVGAPEVASRIARQMKEAPGMFTLRTVLLVEDFGTLGKLQEDGPFVRTLKELSSDGKMTLDIPLYDEEGVNLAGEWRIARLPVLALVGHGRVHVAQGAGVDLKSLFECGR